MSLIIKLNKLKEKKSYLNSVKSLLGQALRADLKNNEINSPKDSEILKLAISLETYNQSLKESLKEDQNENQKESKNKNKSLKSLKSALIHKSNQLKQQDPSHPLPKIVECTVNTASLNLHREHIVSLYNFYEEVLELIKLAKLENDEIVNVNNEIVTTKWNIPITLQSSYEQQSYKDRKILPGKRYDVKVINCVIRADKIFEYLSSKVSENKNEKVDNNPNPINIIPPSSNSPLNMKGRIILLKYLNIAIKHLKKTIIFLKENLLPTSEIEGLLSDCLEIQQFTGCNQYYKNMNNFNKNNPNPINTELDLEGPLKQYTHKYRELLSTHDIPLKNKLRKRVFKGKLPFLPVFFDLAWDHIQF